MNKEMFFFIVYFIKILFGNKNFYKINDKTYKYYKFFDPNAPGTCGPFKTFLVKNYLNEPYQLSRKFVNVIYELVINVLVINFKNKDHDPYLKFYRENIVDLLPYLGVRSISDLKNTTMFGIVTGLQRFRTAYIHKMFVEYGELYPFNAI